MLAAIANRIADYRQGEIPRPTPQHVERWVSQFPARHQDRLLAELDAVLAKTYFSRTAVQTFLNTVAKKLTLTGANPVSFWQNAHILNIQQGGQSQQELTTLFHDILRNEFNVSSNAIQCAKHPVFYIDDVVFSGNRLCHDIEAWLPHCPLAHINLQIVVIGYHRGGKWYADKKIQEAARSNGKMVTVTWWRCFEFEDRRRYVATADVLRPKVLPRDQLATAYEQYLIQQQYPPFYRPGTTERSSQYFASEDGRDFLEEQFLLAGLRVKEMCPSLPEKVRPLGFSALKTFGFGSLIVTYRNCPNTSALALWAGDPWYPLLPRKTNQRVAVWHEAEDYR